MSHRILTAIFTPEDARQLAAVAQQQPTYPAAETWRPVVGWEGLYEVSDHGHVRSVPRTVKRGRGQLRLQSVVLKPSYIPKTGRVWVAMCRNGKNKPRLIHQLVLEAFVGPRPEGLEGCHNNGNSRDNRASNLRWDTKSANALDAVAHGNHYPARKTQCDSGHAFTPQNTRIIQTGPRAGKRVCRICDRAYQAAYRARRRQAVSA